MKKIRVFGLLTLVLAFTFIPEVYAEDPIRNFRVVQGLPDSIVAGNSYEVVFAFDNIAPRPVPFALNVTATCTEAPLGFGEILLEGVCLNGVYLDYVESEPGFFTSTDKWTLASRSSNELSVFLSSVVNLMPGTYTFEFTYGAESVVIPPPPPPFKPPENKKPVADAGLDQTISIGEVAYFSGVGSYDPDGSLVSYRWDFGDGETAQGMNVSHVYSEPRTYTVTLTVEDNMGATDKDICLVKVLGPPPPPPPPPSPARFVVSDLSITPGELELGEEVTISFNVTNVGGQPGTYNATITIDDLTVKREITLEPGETSIISYTFVPSIAGEYGIEVDGLTGTFTVIVPLPPPRAAEFVVTSLTISPIMAEQGLEVEINATVTNIGEEPGTYVVSLEVDGVTTETEEVSLEGGASTTVTFGVTEAVGDHEVRVDGLTDRFTVFARMPGPFWLRPGYIAGILILVLSIGTLASLLKRRKKSDGLSP